MYSVRKDFFQFWFNGFFKEFFDDINQLTIWRSWIIVRNLLIYRKCRMRTNPPLCSSHFLYYSSKVRMLNGFLKEFDVINQLGLWCGNLLENAAWGRTFHPYFLYYSRKKRTLVVMYVRFLCPEKCLLWTNTSFIALLCNNSLFTSSIDVIICCLFTAYHLLRGSFKVET